MRRGQWMVAAGLAGAVAAVGWASSRDPASAAATAAEPPPGVSVQTAQAQKQDVPIVRTGLGSVAPFQTVTVKSQVDGKLIRVPFTEGATVQAGELLAQIDPSTYQAQLAQAQAVKAKDEALLANAKLDLARYQSLRDYATKQSVDTQQATVSQLTAAVAGDQAAIDAVKVLLGYTSITAPITGRAGIRQIDAGNVIHANDPNGLVVITQMQPISVIFTLPQKFLPAINRNQAVAPLKVEAWDESDATKLDDGSLSLVDNQIDPTTGTIKLKATFPNKANQLWPGQFVNAHLLVEVRHDGVTVPAQTVQQGPNGAYAWIVKPDGTVAMQPIEIAQVAGGVALIDKGIAAGQMVVTDGQSKLKTGVRVAAAPAGTQEAAR